MTIKELRQLSGMTQKAFGEYFDIPHRTIQNWEGGQRNCPQYLLDLMEYKLKNEEIIKGETKMKIDTIERNAKNTIANLNNMSEEERLAADGWVSSMMNAKRMLEIVEIFRSLEEDEIKQLKELSKIVVYGDIKSAKPIKEKYNLSWNELKIIIMAF